MASRIVPLDEILDLSFDDVNGFLVAHDSERPCEACGADNWKMTVDSSDKVTQLLMDIPRTDDQLAFVPVFCGNCQNTRLFNSIAVLDWLVNKEGNDGQ